MQLIAVDPTNGGNWVTDINGSLYCWGAAPFIAGLNQHPEYHAGLIESGGQNPCVGIAYWAAFGVDGICYYTAPAGGKGGWAGTPYSQYRFARSGAVDLANPHVAPHVAVLADGSWAPILEPKAA